MLNYSSLQGTWIVRRVFVLFSHSVNDYFQFFGCGDGEYSISPSSFLTIFVSHIDPYKQQSLIVKEGKGRSTLRNLHAAILNDNIKKIYIL